MGRTQRALTSLVAAIPAGVLSYLLVMVFLNRADSLTTMTQVLVGLTLLCSVLVTLMPFGILVFGGKKAAAVDDDDRPSASKKAIDEEDSVEAESADDIEELSDASTETSAFEMDDSDADIMADSDDEITSSSSSLDEIETMEFDEDEEEEEAPKKRKKK